ncbi:MAG: zinc ribbon domain-containing protein [Negativicutes bacterium]|nr:zinc ribbon domain-containing protein [Negativicutes bacterium]
MNDSFDRILQGIKYCPFCGGKLPGGVDECKFCPHCGKPLSVTVTDRHKSTPLPPWPGLPPSPAEDGPGSAGGLSEVMRYYEHLLTEKVRAGMTIGQAREEAAEVLRRAGTRPGGRQADGNQTPDGRGSGAKTTTGPISAGSAPAIAPDKGQQFRPPVNRPAGHQYYSIMLKGCVEKERLADRLARVLLRGYVPVRMAVENIPCLAVYKGKLDSIAKVVDVLVDEKAAFAVIAGDVPAVKSWRQLMADHHPLNDVCRRLLDQLSVNYWLGESLTAGFTSCSFNQQPGMVVLGGQSLFFITGESDRAGCLALPYYRMEDSHWAGEDRRVILRYSDSRRVDTLELADGKTAGIFFAAVSRAKGRWRQQLKFRLTCCSCLTMETVDFLPGLARTTCSQCGGESRRDLLITGGQETFSWY